MTVAVYDALGRRVRTLVDEEQQEGRQEVTLRAKGLASGVYFVRLTTGNFTAMHRVVLVR